MDDVGVGLSMVPPPSLDASPSPVGVVADSLADDPDADAVVWSFAGVFTVTSLPELFPFDEEFVVASGCLASSDVVEPFTDKGFKIYAVSIMISANQEAVCVFLTLPETVEAA